ncbi:hypothetical protein BDV37DRAFT_257993 [Aspergillus pseudonomiae]|uniref:Uncharacterized protein n=1 Tax=Aspergillus pseudonomiae TaxID=1506151 RepID=A0A5N7D1R8_9EURO|nr:uncharacterized protein BDV37DRAFT_257993 [Aspergillus pseudonomiae]KAE8400356.1 hypothetical protein BDV37DRAFT_257993 [Aspergillus pseudonomiae]
MEVFTKINRQDNFMELCGGMSMLSLDFFFLMLTRGSLERSPKSIDNKLDGIVYGKGKGHFKSSF